MRELEMGFDIHWILIKGKSSKRIYLATNWLAQVPPIGAELRNSEKDFYKVVSVVWCLDEKRLMGQRVNIGIEKVK